MSEQSQEQMGVGLSVPSDEVGFAAPRHPPTALLGWVALALAVFCVVADVIAVSLAVDRAWVSATLLAQALNVCTTIVFFIGLFAVWRRPARWLGLLAMIIAVLANPFILTHLLEFLNG